MRRGRLITIGSFDGVHRGHQALLDRTVAEAKKRNVRSLALTFPIPPRMVLDKKIRRVLLSNEIEKEWLIRRQGINDVAIVPFGHGLAVMRPFGFFRDVLINQYKAVGIVVGSDFRFGADRMGGAVELVRWGEDFNIPVWVISPVRWKRQVVSSTLIRSFLQEGRFAKAESFLGHPYVIAGRVVPGRGVGRKIGFRTANVATHPDKILPRGVFAVEAWVHRASGRAASPMRGVCNIGVRPTFGKNGRPAVEVHLPGRSVDLRGKTLFVQIRKRLREEKRFRSPQELVRQIARDIRAAEIAFGVSRL